MFLTKRKFLKLFAVFAGLFCSLPAWAAGPPATNPLNNPLAVLLISVMIILLITIGILANILIGAADVKALKRKQQEAKKSLVPQAAAIFIGLMLLSLAGIAQEKTTVNTTAAVASTIGGLSASTFYVMVSIIFLELLVILVLLVNIRLLIRSEKRSLATAENAEPVVARTRINWWNWFNKLKPIEQEADLDLGHDYDGIRELDNRLPPWWIYGFYITIIVGGIYFWRYHISHTAPLSREEYEIAVQKADQKTKEFLKQKGDVIDENTVTVLGGTDIAEGKQIFQKSCVACHLETGGGMVGPNLTDDYWIHGGDIKSIFKTIKYGINAMPTWQNAYNNKQIAQVASYVKSLKGTNPPNAKAPQGELFKEEAKSNKTDTLTAKKDNKIAAR